MSIPPDFKYASDNEGGDEDEISKANGSEGGDFAAEQGGDATDDVEDTADHNPAI